MRPSYPVSRLDYALPAELIAQHPLPQRTASRLLHVRVADGSIADRGFSELPQLIPPGTLLVFNDSRVLPARVFGAREHHRTGQGGGRVEVLYLRYIGDGVCEAVVGSNARLKPGEMVELPGGWRCGLLEGKSLDGVHVRYLTSQGAPAALPDLLTYLAQHGLPPLPPYIKRDNPAGQGPDAATAADAAEADAKRYQTVYARHDGSSAAPTAGLHFDNAMLARLQADGHTLVQVTLHVGLGTFAPLRVDDLAAHVMHEEAYSVEPGMLQQYRAALSAGRTVAAVGTTSLRVLHTVLAQGPGETAAGRGVDVLSRAACGMTDAFIYPGCGTRACDLLLTNFHLPRSTLLALVYAFGGEELLRAAYAHAIKERYRFFSYGDCMLIDRRR